MKDEQLHTEIARFMESSLRNQWIYGSFSTLYIRKSIRFINGQKWKCIDIATIVIDEEMRNQGILTSLLNEVKVYALPIYAESVNSIAEKVCRRLGFIEHELSSEFTKNFYHMNSIIIPSSI